MSWLPPVTQGLGRALFVAFAFGIGTAVVAGLALRSCMAPEQVETATAKVVQELAEERIPQIEAQSKATRRADRERVDQEVQRAAGDSDLVDYIGSR